MLNKHIYSIPRLCGQGMFHKAVHFKRVEAGKQDTAVVQDVLNSGNGGMTFGPAIIDLDKLLLKVEEAAQYCGISRAKAYYLVKNWTWPSVRTVKSLRIPRKWLVNWLQSQVVVFQPVTQQPEMDPSQ